MESALGAKLRVQHAQAVSVEVGVILHPHDTLLQGGKEVFGAHQGGQERPTSWVAAAVQRCSKASTAARGVSARLVAPGCGMAWAGHQAMRLHNAHDMRESQPKHAMTPTERSRRARGARALVSKHCRLLIAVRDTSDACDAFGGGHGNCALREADLLQHRRVRRMASRCACGGGGTRLVATYVGPSMLKQKQRHSPSIRCAFLLCIMCAVG